MRQINSAGLAPDQDILARTLYGEAEPRDEADAIAIAWVVRNRASLPRWPDSISAVCLQPRQFSCWNDDNPRLNNIKHVTPEKDIWFARCVDVAGRVMAGKVKDPTTRSTHYYADYIKAPRWAKGKIPVYETPAGKFNHLFFNDIDTPAPAKAPPEKPSRKKQAATGFSITAVGAAVAGLSGFEWKALAVLAIALVAGGIAFWLIRRGKT